MFRRLGHRLRQLPSIAFWYDPPVPHGQIYYVDATAGNDANDGLHPLRAWQTIGQVNGEAFDPEDRILFRRGETWVGVTLVPPSSGVPGRPIIFGAYGVGANPITDGNDLLARCIHCLASDHIRFENIETQRAQSYGFDISNSEHILMQDCTAHSCGDDNISIGEGSHDVLLQRVVSYDAYRLAPGPTIACIEIQDGAYDIVLDDCECYGSEEIGINIQSHLSPAVLPWNITIRNSSIHNNDTHGIQITNAGDLSASPSILINNCNLEDNGAGPGVFGIYIWNALPAVDPSNITVEDCILSGNTGYQTSISGDGHTFRRNLIITSPFGILITDATNMDFFNNTIYNTAPGTILGVIGTDNSGTEFKNNVIYTSVAANPIIDVGIGAEVGLDIDYNLWYHVSGVGANRWLWIGNWYNWANWLINSGQDANSPTPADPLFVNPGADDFTLQAGSPAIDAGVNVGLPYLGTAPDCGVFERE